MDPDDNLLDCPRLTQNQLELLFFAAEAAHRGKGILCTKNAKQEYINIQDEIAKVLHNADPNYWIEVPK